MSEKCCHEVHITGDNRLVAAIGVRLTDRPLASAGDVSVVVIGQNLYLQYETRAACLAIAKSLAASFPEARVVHRYQAVSASTRGIVIYDHGRLTELRQVEGQPFCLDDWVTFPSVDVDCGEAA